MKRTALTVGRLLAAGTSALVLIVAASCGRSQLASAEHPTVEWWPPSGVGIPGSVFEWHLTDGYKARFRSCMGHAGQPWPVEPEDVPRLPDPAAWRSADCGCRAEVPLDYYSVRVE